MADTSCLYTTVRNTSGAVLPAHYLPPRGRNLAIGEEFSFIGQPAEAIARGCGDRGSGIRHIAAFERDLAAGNLTIVATPAPVLMDLETTESKILVLDNTDILLADPC